MKRPEFLTLFRWALSSSGLDRRIRTLEKAGGGPPGGGAEWGDITGTLSAQTDLQTALDGKQAAGSYEPAIAAGTTGQYWRGDKTWQTLPAAGGPVGAEAPITAVPVNNSTTPQTLATKTISVSAGDLVQIEVWGTFLNNSGGTVTPVVRFSLGSLNVDLSDGATTATNASNRNAWRINGVWAVQSASNVLFQGEFRHGTAAAANTAMSTALANNRSIWQTSSSNLTGSVACTVGFRSSTATATQTFTVLGWRVSKTGTV